MATERSDSDVILVVTDDSRAVHSGSHSTELDIGAYTLTELQSPALPRELSHHPLAAPVVARSAGFLDVLDSWGDDLTVFGAA